MAATNDKKRSRRDTGSALRSWTSRHRYPKHYFVWLALFAVIAIVRAFSDSTGTADGVVYINTAEVGATFLAPVIPAFISWGTNKILSNQTKNVI